MRRQLLRPPGTTNTKAVGLTDLAGVGGSWNTDGIQGDDVAVRWPLTGGAGTVIGNVDSRVAAVGTDDTPCVYNNSPPYRTIAATVESWPGTAPAPPSTRRPAQYHHLDRGPAHRAAHPDQRSGIRHHQHPRGLAERPVAAAARV
jgi:hypothetical protein